ncbi:MAG TPA: DUF4157 domain-containing protein [Allosphingosinicella sp.]|jgi:hypothetical protein|nr:DUF4157 domain-containing protein [Allosphingosinicella sp.]
MAYGIRTLSAGEVALLRPIFGERLDYERVRLNDGYGINHIAALALSSPAADAVTLRRTIYFGRHLADDFAEASLIGQGLLAHELVHVMQWAERGVPRFAGCYLCELVKVGFVQKRMYQYAAGQPFAAAGLEAQAQMVQDYFLRRALGKPRDHLEKSLAGTGLFGL